MKGKIAFIIIFVIGIICLAPYLVLLGWNCARELWPELPVASYRQAFWITNAIMILFKTTGSKVSKS